MKNINNLKGGVVTFEKFNGRKDIGSSRIRGEWLCNHWENLQIFKQGGQYDFILYQKAYWVEHAKKFKGIKIFDICDPDFLHFGYRTKEMIEECDAVTTSTRELAEQFKNFTDKPVVCIPDRVDLNIHTLHKMHKGRAKKVVWYGYSDNFEMLHIVMHFLEKFGLDLIVISNKNFLPQMNYVKPEIEVGMNTFETDEVLEEQKKKKHWVSIKNIRWNHETADRDILEGDIVINPTSKNGKWKYKSNNKTIKSWALGMPVAQDINDLEKFLDENERRDEANKRLIEVKQEWDVKKSVEEYKKLIKKLSHE